jgi:hypothetical protein
MVPEWAFDIFKFLFKLQYAKPVALVNGIWVKIPTEFFEKFRYHLHTYLTDKILTGKFKKD